MLCDFHLYQTGMPNKGMRIPNTILSGFAVCRTQHIQHTKNAPVYWRGEAEERINQICNCVHLVSESFLSLTYATMHASQEETKKEWYTELDSRCPIKASWENFSTAKFKCWECQTLDKLCEHRMFQQTISHVWNVWQVSLGYRWSFQFVIHW